MKKKNIIFLVIAIALLLSSVILLFKYSHAIHYDSDNVSGILEAHSFMQGNYLLHSFALSVDNFYLTDLPFYVIYESIAGMNALEISFVPIAIYSLLIIIASILVSLNFKDIAIKLKGAITVIILLGFPSFFLLNTTLTGQVHVGTILYILISFIFFKLLISKNQIWYILPLFIFEFIYLLSDPLSIWIGALPIIITSIILLIQKRELVYKYLSIIFITIVNLFLAKILPPFIQSIGGFHLVSPVSYTFAHLSQIPYKIYLGINSILYYFGAHFLGKKLFLLSTIEELIKALFILLLIYILYKIIKTKKLNIINLLLISAMLLNLLAFIFSNIAKNMSFARYLMPFTIFALIFIAMNIVPLLKKKLFLYISVIFAIFLIFSFIYRVDHFPESSNIQNEKALVSFLEKHNLSYGIGTYWDSSITTALSSNKAKVRAILVTENNIYPLIWLSSTKWYRHKFNFFVYGNNKYDKISNDYNLALSMFKNPYKEYMVSGFTVLVYRKNIDNILLSKNNV